jgi:hypothetical protein
MRKRAWSIEWKARPAHDGIQRLGQGVALILDRARRAARLVEHERRGEEIPIPAGDVAGHGLEGDK